MLRTQARSAAACAALVATDRRKPVIRELTPAARAAGVEPGMTTPQAVARCRELCLCHPLPAAEEEARRGLFAAAFSLSPRIEDSAPGVCTVDLAGAPPGLREPAARAALTQLEALGLQATAGLARTPWLALLAARAATPAEPLCVVADERAFLAPLPLASIEPPADLAGVLADWGLRTLGHLTALPKAEVTRRLGAAGLACWERAAGLPERPLRPVPPPREFTAAFDFEEEVETLEPLLFILRRFLDRLALDLTNAGFVAAGLELRLLLADETRHERIFRLPEPTGDPAILFRAVHTHLETLHTGAPVAGLRLLAVPCRTLVRQQGLFDTGLRDPHGFAETLARLIALAGSGSTGTPRLEPSHRPDAVVLEPPAPVIPPGQPPPVHPPLGLPLRRFRPPVPAVVETVALQPAALDSPRARGQIVDRRGPWRASGDWWQADTAWSRLEWDIELEHGGLYRLLRTREGWFLEGEYD